MSIATVDVGAVVARRGHAIEVAHRGGAMEIARRNDPTEIPHRGDATTVPHRGDVKKIPCSISVTEAPWRHDPSEVVRRLRGELERFHHRRAKRAGWSRRFIPTGLAPVDAALPYGGLPCGAITEILFDAPGVGAMSLAMRIVRRCLGGGDELALPVSGAVDHSSKELPIVNCQLPIEGPFTGASNWQLAIGNRQSLGKGTAHDEAARQDHRSVVLVDALGDFYPPAARLHDIEFERLIVLRPRNERDAFWAVDQSLRCPAVAVVIAPLMRLDDCLSRRLQLAAESSGCMGLILRSARRRTKSFAAIQMLLESVDQREADERAARPCRITLLSVREGMPTEPLLVDLHHETGIGTFSPLPVDRSAAKTG